MAILWSLQDKDTLYEVRQAGQSLRLYTNGVLHSQYNPRRSVTGSVWDCLSLPALFYPAGTIQRVLVLGVGGGAVLHQLAEWVNPALIIGIELNPHHLYVSKKFFGLERHNVVLYEADAKHWLEHYDGPPFDLIIDDLYGEFQGEPVRAIELQSEWCELLLRHVAVDGALVVNTISWQELKKSALVADSKLTQAIKIAFRLCTPTCDNAVGFFSKSKLKKSTFQKRLESIPELARADQNGTLRYQMRRYELNPNANSKSKR